MSEFNRGKTAYMGECHEFLGLAMKAEALLLGGRISLERRDGRLNFRSYAEGISQSFEVRESAEVYLVQAITELMDQIVEMATQCAKAEQKANWERLRLAAEDAADA